MTKQTSKELETTEREGKVYVPISMMDGFIEIIESDIERMEEDIERLKRRLDMMKRTKDSALKRAQ